MTQEKLTLKLISSKSGITNMELLMLGVASPSKVISRLRDKGVRIHTKRSDSGTVYKIGTPLTYM